jgi:Dolichyl-phosphate-mannose-protein mannosyltransferase
MSRKRRRFWNHPATIGGLIALIAAAAAARTTDVHAPPRFDGAGYAVLAEALQTGQGYREIDRPDAPRHAHFPPGYPTALAALWRLTGRSVVSAHLAALACTTAATVAAWLWFRRLYDRPTATCLGLALALNWTWNRVGGSIQSEPLFLLLQQLAVLGAIEVGRRGGVRGGLALGGLLAACVLTRHVGAALALAVVLHLLLTRRHAAAVAVSLGCLSLLLPWAAWLASVREHTQAGLLVQGRLAERVATLAVFYVQRLPDQFTGPLVEIATVFRRSGPVAAAANAWAGLATGLIVVGWVSTLATARRRLAGLIAGCTLALLLVWPFTEAGRFLIPLVPCLLVGATEGLAALAARAGSRRPRAAAAGLVLALSLPYSIYALMTDRASAQRRTYADFDAACAWVAREGPVVGPVMTRHPGEVYWQTGRKAIAPPSNDPEAISRLIEQYGAAYLVVDEQRYANAPESPLLAYIQRHPERVREAWKRRSGRSSVAVYEIVPARGLPGS